MSRCQTCVEKKLRSMVNERNRRIVEMEKELKRLGQFYDDVQQLHSDEELDETDRDIGVWKLLETGVS